MISELDSLIRTGQDCEAQANKLMNQLIKNNRGLQTTLAKKTKVSRQSISKYLKKGVPLGTLKIWVEIIQKEL